MAQEYSFSYFALARRYGGDYQFQGRISNVRWTNKAITVAGGLGKFQLKHNEHPEPSICAQDNPATDITARVPLGLRGSGTVLPGPMPSLGDYIV